MYHPVIPLLVALVYPLTLLHFASMVIVVLALLSRRNMVGATRPRPCVDVVGNSVLGFVALVDPLADGPKSKKAATVSLLVADVVPKDVKMLDLLRNDDTIIEAPQRRMSRSPRRSNTRS